MASQLILIVCTANICRSPLAQILMETGVDERLGIRVESVGTHARGGDPICDLAADRLSSHGYAQQATSHRARSVEADVMEQAGLILTASREVRSEIVRLSPRVRDRTYTLREAAHRGSGFQPRAVTRRGGAVVSYAAHLDQARAMMPPVPATRSVWRRGGRSEDTMSILDGHVARGRAHRMALDAVTESVETIVAQLNRSPSR